MTEFDMLFLGLGQPSNRVEITGMTSKVVSVDIPDDENVNIKAKPVKAKIKSGFFTEEVDIVDISVDAQGRESWLIRKEDGQHMLVFDFLEDVIGVTATWNEFKM